MAGKKIQVSSNFSSRGPGLDAAALRMYAQSNPQEFVRKVEEIVEGTEKDKGLRWRDIRRVDNLYEALRDVRVSTFVEDMNKKRAITTSAFPILAGSLTVAGINEGFEAVPTIGQDLCTDMEDNKKDTHLISITSTDPKTDRVEEAKDFPEIGAGEELYTIRHKRNGRRISITAEMIEENDVPGIEQRCNALGEIASELIEEQTLRRVYDVDGSATTPAEPYVLRLNNAGTSLYSTTANTPGTRTPNGNRITNNALTGASNLETARIRLASMLNYRLKRINIPVSRMKLVVPTALVTVATQILNSEYTPGVFNEISNWGPRGDYRPKLISSPKLDDISTTAWLFGWLERQFKRKFKLKLENFILAGSQKDFLMSRIAYQARLAWDVEVGAADYVFVTQNLSGTTAPTA